MKAILVYDGGMNAVLIDYRETIKTEDVNEQKTDDRNKRKGKKVLLLSRMNNERRKRLEKLFPPH